MSRRTLLRGSSALGSIAIGLPLLDAMLNTNGTALAQNGEAIPKRIGIWYWGNGLRPEHFFPAYDAGARRAIGTPGSLQSWDPSLRQHTQPLAQAGLSPYISLITGTSTASSPGVSHHNGRLAIPTGSFNANSTPARGYAAPVTPSFDQLAASAWEGLTPFRSLELGVQEGPANNEVGNAGHYVSCTGPDTFAPPEFSPAAVFQRLFMGQGSTDAPDPALMRLLAARRSVLDSVRSDLTRLNRDLGAKDKACLDQHLSQIRLLESRLADPRVSTGACQIPGVPPADYPTTEGKQILRGRNESMSQVLALALTCDMTRAFTYQFTVFQTAHDFSAEPELAQLVESSVGAPFEGSFHEAAHDPGFQDNVRIVMNFTFENLARTLKLLADVPEGDGTVLGNCAILCTTEHTEPVTHSIADIPMIVAGVAGGKLKGGMWYHGADEKVSKAGLTMLRAVGVQAEKFGSDQNDAGDQDNQPSTTETFVELEA